MGKAIASQCLQSASSSASTASTASTPALSGGSATIAASVFNLAKTIIGAGVLSLPYGIAAFTDSKAALAPAIALLVVMGAISAYGYSSIGKACAAHKATSFSEVWSKAVSPRTGSLLNGIIIFKTFFACLAFSIIIGDSFSSIFKSWSLPEAFSQRNNALLILTISVLLPLSLLRKLDALKYTSILGLLGTLYTAGFMTKRFYDGSYRKGGEFFEELETKPYFDSRPLLWSDPRLFCFAELKNATVGRFQTVTALAFAVAVIVNVAIAALGFLSFGGSTLGLVLNNYSSRDQLATAGRVAIALGLLCSYPLAFAVLRDSVLETLPLSLRSRLFYPLIVGLLAIISFFAFSFKDVGKVVSFSGALIGSLFIYIIPAALNIGTAFKKPQGANQQQLSLTQKVEVGVNSALIAFGIVAAFVGVRCNLQH
eukprot:scaffold5788_cov159-Ochromonas_danica.AAC.7